MVYLFDSSTLITERDKDWFKNQDSDYAKSLKERKFSDSLLKMNHQLPSTFILPLKTKYGIDRDGINSVFEMKDVREEQSEFNLSDLHNIRSYNRLLRQQQMSKLAEKN